MDIITKQYYVSVFAFCTCTCCNRVHVTCTLYIQCSVCQCVCVVILILLFFSNNFQTEQMMNEFKTHQSEMKSTLKLSTEELKSLQIAIEKEKTTLNELKKLNETISKEILKLQQEKHLLEDSLKTLMAEKKSLSIIPSSAHPQPINHTLQSIDNLVFTNPAANSTSVSGDGNMMMSSNSLSNKETLDSMSDGHRSRRGSGDVSSEGTSYRERVLRTLHVSELQSINIEPEIVVKQPFTRYPLATATSPLYNGPKPLQQHSNGPIASQHTALTSQQTPLPLQQYSNGPITPLPLQQNSGILLHGSVQGGPFHQPGCGNGFQKQQCCRVCCCSHYLLGTDNGLNNDNKQLHKVNKYMYISCNNIHVHVHVPIYMYMYLMYDNVHSFFSSYINFMKMCSGLLFYMYSD